MCNDKSDKSDKLDKIFDYDPNKYDPTFCDEHFTTFDRSEEFLVEIDRITYNLNMKDEDYPDSYKNRYRNEDLLKVFEIHERERRTEVLCQTNKLLKHIADSLHGISQALGKTPKSIY